MSASSRLVRVALALLAGLALLLPGAGTAGAATGLQIHHLLPADGAVLATAPDHVEIMFDRDLVPGGVDVAIAPDDTGLLVALPRQPVVDGPVVVAPLPALAPGHYTVGVQVVDRAGHVQRGTFGFTVDPAATPTGTSRSDDLAWLVPAAATALLLPAALLALRRRTRR
jgi:copper resistance protein C